MIHFEPHARDFRMADMLRPVVEQVVFDGFAKAKPGRCQVCQHQLEIPAQIERQGEAVV